MTPERAIRAMQLALNLHGLGEGIEHQAMRTRLGRTCRAGEVCHPSKCIRYGAEAIFERENQFARGNWARQMGGAEDRRQAFEAYRRLMDQKYVVDRDDWCL